MLRFKRIHTGFYRAVSDITDDGYVVRTRPLNDGWMAINEHESLVLATGMSFANATATCDSYDQAVAESIEREEP